MVKSNIINSTYAIVYNAVRVQHKCEDGYLEWYLNLSHPRITQVIEHTHHIVSFNIGVLGDDVLSPPPPDTDDQERLQMVALIMDNLMGLKNPDGELFTRLSRTAHIARGRPI